ncbi:tRNA (adenosine(37)-N6)-threonylcarbamoyltransferase complex dimerization subunit type 1 TsaB [Pleomorphovibrio marinus]|uniref:tRNA (adenosine(37)-N6)-threonylcarbamoyltransferase complex dimerization subunit type 1 TsaB n=1 Tax=Pleomorphovibrio marinus TaxID=2164132 RepID=UPI000E0AB0C1|nr:tRNA (adenosine(37)-N6)-threonylcarbamoyltransferase complex dimerization subunit type 1 TsaB [Pleomorphovibrio marinus]
MKRILSIETFTKVCAVALHQEGKLLGAISLHDGNVHGQKLVPLIEALLLQFGLKVSRLDAIAVSKGPGSYTGLRIGVSTAKGLCYAHDLPLIGIDSLNAYAFKANSLLKPGDLVVPMIDARRMEVYTKVLNHEWQEVESIKPKILDGDSFGEYLSSGKVYFTGDANEKVSQVLSHPNAYFIDGVESVDEMGRLAWQAFNRGSFEDLAYFEPNYPKAFLVKKAKNPLLR